MGSHVRSGGRSPSSNDPLAIRSELYVRIMGWWMCVFVLIGLVVVTTSSGPLAAIPVGVFWVAPGLFWGWRLSHLGVFEEPDVLLVRNPFRTYRIPYAEIIDITDGVAWVSLNRPKVRNAINSQMQAELAEVWRAFRHDDDVRCVVLAAEGAPLCANWR